MSAFLRPTRRNGTNGFGRSFAKQEIDAVWSKARPVPGELHLRFDACGALMRYQDYGTTESFGWEIDHIVPIAKGGTDHIDNLQPLQWQNNRGKSDDFPKWTCSVKWTGGSIG